MQNLLVSVLGYPNSGKSSTWNALFGSTVKTGSYPRRLELRPGEFVEVFLISGSPQERDKLVQDIMGEQLPRIVLCSTQYRADVTQTFEFFRNNGYQIYTQWLNPGFHDPNSSPYFDYLGLVNFLLSNQALVCMRDGKVALDPRVQEIREFIYGWAKYRNLIVP